MLDVALSVERRGLRVAVAFSVAAGERLGLFGPSGAGKSTLLEAVAGLVERGQGSVRLDGRELVGLAAHERRVGLLRQEPALFPHLSVAENLAYARLDRPPGAVQGLARRLGIEALLDERPARLSGGQRQRVALGRLLLAEPVALLLDEPFEGLEAALRRELTELVRSEVAERRVPAVLVSHELAEVQAFADRVALLDRGELIQVAPADEIVRLPASVRAAELLGYSAFVPLGGSREAGGARLGVHPERVLPGAHPRLGPVLRGRVGEHRPQGAGWQVALEVEGTVVPVHLHELSVGSDEEMEITLVDPPRFGVDGRRLQSAATSAGKAATGSRAGRLSAFVEERGR